jgi:hypothetical protein
MTLRLPDVQREHPETTDPILVCSYEVIVHLNGRRIRPVYGLKRRMSSSRSASGLPPSVQRYFQEIPFQTNRVLYLKYYTVPIKGKPYNIVISAGRCVSTVLVFKSHMDSAVIS